MRRTWRLSDQFDVQCRPAVVFDFRDDGAMVGSALVSEIGGGKVCIYRLFVHPSHRRQGVATEILHRIRECYAGRVLALQPEPFGVEPPLSADDLTAWYVRLGFSKPGPSGTQFLTA